VGVGFGIYLGLNQLVYGEPLAFLVPQKEHWFKSLATPWEGIDGVLGWLGSKNPDNVLMQGWMELTFIAIGLVGTIHAALRLRLSWFVWMAGNLLLFVSTSFVMSTPRYVLTMFPLYVSLALLSRRRVALALISAVSIGALIYFTGRFATGAWAF
jgi:hypothetical protein